MNHTQTHNQSLLFLQLFFTGISKKKYKHLSAKEQELSKFNIISSLLVYGTLSVVIISLIVIIIGFLIENEEDMIAPVLFFWAVVSASLIFFTRTLYNSPIQIRGGFACFLIVLGILVLMRMADHSDGATLIGVLFLLQIIFYVSPLLLKANYADDGSFEAQQKVLRKKKESLDSSIAILESQLDELETTAYQNIDLAESIEFQREQITKKLELLYKKREHVEKQLYT